MSHNFYADIHYFSCLCAEDMPFKYGHAFQNTMYKGEPVGGIRGFGYVFYLSLFCHCTILLFCLLRYQLVSKKTSASILDYYTDI